MPIAWRQRAIILVPFVIFVIIAVIFIILAAVILHVVLAIIILTSIVVSLGPFIGVFFVADHDIEEIIGVDREHQFVIPFHVEQVDLVTAIAVNQLCFVNLRNRRIDVFGIGLRTALLPKLLVSQNFSRRVLAAEVAFRCYQPMAVPANDGQVVPGIVGGIFVDVVFFNRMPRLMTDAARVAVRRHQLVLQLARNR